MQQQESSSVKPARQPVSDHLANERTLLAWVRTSIGIMAFGFVVVKFSLFIRQLSVLTGKEARLPQYGYSAPIGILLVAAGVLCLLLAVLRYRKTARQLNDGNYRPASGLLYLMVGFILIVSTLLIIYLVSTT